MKYKDLQASLIAFVLSLCLGFASVACMLTGYNLRAEPAVLFLLCLLLSALFTGVFCSRHRRWISLGLGGLLLLLVIFNQTFQNQTISMVTVISKVFAQAYNLPDPDFPLYFYRPNHLLPLLTIHSIISFTSTWVLLHRKSVFWSAIPALAALCTCFLTLDSVPQTQYILLWFFAFALILLTHPVRQQNVFQGIRLTKLLALPVALALVLMLILIPADGSTVPDVPKWDITMLWTGDSPGPNVGNGSGGSGGSGGSETPILPSHKLQLNTLGPRQPENVPVMDVTAGYTGGLYLRTRDYDTYDMTAWHASTDRVENGMEVPSGWIVINGPVDIQTYGFHDYLYLPTYTHNAPVMTGGAVPNTLERDEYTFISISMQDNWLKQWRSGTRIPSQEVDPRYLALPDRTRDDAQNILAEILGLSTADIPDKAQLICDYVRQSALYNQQTSAMPAGQTDFAIWFLQEAETGYCVHFATAATVLLRAAGIPARYVEGYYTQTVQNNAVTVTDVEAHAWVEYYVDGAGWIIMEPTNTAIYPTVPPSTQPTTPPTTVPTTVPTTKPPVTTVPPSSDRADTGSASMAGWLIWALVCTLCLVAVILILISQYVIRRKIKKRRLRRGYPNEQASIRYKEATRLAAFSGLPIPEELTFLAEKAIFSQYVLTAEELKRFDTFFQSCAATMGQKNLLRRFYLRFLRAAY